MAFSKSRTSATRGTVFSSYKDLLKSRGRLDPGPIVEIFLRQLLTTSIGDTSCFRMH
jgi:hypothetical protein